MGNQGTEALNYLFILIQKVGRGARKRAWVFLLMALFAQGCGSSQCILRSFEVIRSELLHVDGLYHNSLFFSLSYRAEKYGPVVRLNAFHRVSLMIVSPEGVKVLQNKAESTVGISPSLQKERGGA